MTAADKIYWSKFAAALGMAVLTLIGQVYLKVSGSILFMFGALVYMGLSDLLSSRNGIDRSRGIKIGVGVFFFSWMVVWVLLYTVVRTMG